MPATLRANTRNPVVVAGTLAAALAALAACRDTDAPPAEANPIIVAGTRSATGGLRTEGMNMARGFELAVKMLNEAGGIGDREVRLVLHDDRSDPGRAEEIYLELASADSIDLLIGPR